MFEVHPSKILNDIQWLSLQRKNKHCGRSGSMLKDDKVFITAYKLEKGDVDSLSIYIGKQIADLIDFKVGDVIAPRINLEKHICQLKKNTENMLGYKFCEYRPVADVYKMYINLDVMKAKGHYDCSGIMHETTFEIFDDKSVIFSLEPILKSLEGENQC